MQEIMERLGAQDRALAAILAALEPPEQSEGSGLDDLIQALVDLSVQVAAQGAEIAALRSAVSGSYKLGAEAA